MDAALVNVCAYFSIIAAAKINQLKFEFLPHLPYSPDLALSDYGLFLTSKIDLFDVSLSKNYTTITKLEHR